MAAGSDHAHSITGVAKAYAALVVALQITAALFCGLAASYVFKQTIFGTPQEEFDPTMWRSATVESGARRSMEEDLKRLLQTLSVVDKSWVLQTLGTPDFIQEPAPMPLVHQDIATIGRPPGEPESEKRSPQARRLVRYGYGTSLLDDVDFGDMHSVRVFFLDLDETDNVCKYGTRSVLADTWDELNGFPPNTWVRHLTQRILKSQSPP